MNRPSTAVRLLAVLALCIAPGCALWQPTSLIDRLRERRQTHGTLVVAHRGASATFPENTLPSFAAGVRAGADLVELDFYQTRDGILVCFHDRKLTRTTDSLTRGIPEDRRIADLTAADLEILDAGSWKASEFAGTRIPTLEAALRTITPGAIAMIEHKAGDPRKLVDLLRDLEMIDKVVVQSFDWDFLVSVHALEPALTTGVLGGGRSRPQLDEISRERLVETGARFAHWNHQKLTDAELAWLHRQGLLVMVYTVNEPAAWDAAFRRGIDGITTDRPAACLARRRQG